MATPIEADSLKERELSKMETTGSVVMTKDLFEKLYLSPQTNVAGNLRKTFANPTPLGLAGFLLSITPLACDLMEWRGAGMEGAASVGSFYYLGGVIAILVAIGEFILGNSFPVVIFGTYGGFFLAYGATLTPFYNAVTPYADSSQPAALAPLSPGFLASIAYLFVFMAVFNFIMLICATRTNAVYFSIFVCLECSFCFIASADFIGATGDYSTLQHYNKIAGGFTFAAAMLGWYLFTAEMFALVDFPLQLPVGDLSNLIKGASTRKGAKNPNNMV